MSIAEGVKNMPPEVAQVLENGELAA